MDKIIIRGGHPLTGSVKISGSKNSALPILAATLLTKERCVIQRVPDLSDVHYMLQILAHLGADVERASGIVTVQAEKVDSVAPYEIVRKMRASVCVLGPLLGREKEATVSLPGGCVIGDRPIDLHLRGFQALGAAVRVHAGNVKVFAPSLHGATISLRGKFGTTVLGTDNIMMAAVLADGTTIIEDAACEPEVVDLANFLNKMGAKIEGAGTARIVIEGVKELHGAEHEVIPDRIEAGTFLIAGAIAGKEITVNRVRPDHLTAVTDALQACGFRVSGTNGSLSHSPQWNHKIVESENPAVPGFSDGYAGPDVRFAFNRCRREFGDREHFSSAFHACFGVETDGSDHRIGRRHGQDSGRGQFEWGAGDGERSPGIGRIGSGRVAGRRNDRNQPGLPHRSRVRDDR